MITFDRDEGDLATIVENNVILEGIKRSLAECTDTVYVKYNTRAKHYHLPHQRPGSSLVDIELNDGTSIRTRLLVRNYKFDHIRVQISVSPHLSINGGISSDISSC